MDGTSAPSLRSTCIRSLVSCAGTVVESQRPCGRMRGAVVEGAMAWTAGKAVVLFKDDAALENRLALTSSRRRRWEDFSFCESQ